MIPIMTIFGVAILLVTLVTLDTYFIAVQDTEVKESDLVQDCDPIPDGAMIPLVDISNNTHKFLIHTCTWSPTDDGTPGLIKSIYTKFVEPHILDLIYG